MIITIVVQVADGESNCESIFFEERRDMNDLKRYDLAYVLPEKLCHEHEKNSCSMVSASCTIVSVTMKCCQ